MTIKPYIFLSLTSAFLFIKAKYLFSVTAWQLQLELYPDHLLNVTVKFENETITILYYTKRVPVVIQRTEICACSLRSNERPGVTHDRGTRNRVTRNKATQKRVTLDYDVMQEGKGGYVSCI